MCRMVKIVLTAEILLDSHPHWKNKIFLLPYMLVWDQYESWSECLLCCLHPTCPIWHFPHLWLTQQTQLPWFYKFDPMFLNLLLYFVCLYWPRPKVFVAAVVFVVVCFGFVHCISQSPKMTIYLPASHPSHCHL